MYLPRFSAALWVIVSVLQSTLLADQFRVVATSQDYFANARLGAAVLNNNGASAFIANMDGIYFVDSSGTPVQVLDNGGTIDGLPGPVRTAAIAANTPLVWLSDNDRITAAIGFQSAMEGIRGAVWNNDSNGGVIAYDGQTILAGDNFYKLILPNPTVSQNGLQVNRNGQVAGHSKIADSSGHQSDALWTASNNRIQIIAREGESFGSFQLANLSSVPAITDAGRIVFRADLVSSGGSGGGSGIFSWEDGVITEQFNVLGTIPGTANDLFLSFMSPIAFGDDQIAFRANVFTANGTGYATVVQNADDTFRLVGEKGSPTPGFPGGTFGTVGTNANTSIAINDKGDVTFPAFTVGSTQGFQLWSDGGPVGLHVVAADQTPVPEIVPTTNFPVGMSINSLSYPTLLNSAGQLAFQTIVGRTPDNQLLTAWFAEDRQGVLHLIAQIGDEVELAPGDIWTISRMAFQQGNVPTLSGSDDPVLFNDKGELIFAADLVQGPRTITAILVSDKVAVPEMRSITSVAIASCFLFLTLRSRQLNSHNRQTGEPLA